MTIITLQEAQATLPELIHGLAPGDALQIIENGRPIAMVTASPRTGVSSATQEPRKLGTQAGSVLYMAPDFDAPLEDLKEYLE